MGVLVQPEIGFEAFSGNIFHRVVHAPVTAAAKNLHAVDFQHEIRGERVVVQFPVRIFRYIVPYFGNENLISPLPARRIVEYRVAFSEIRR